MSGEPGKKIVITFQDLQSKRVDEALARQMSFGMPGPAAKKEKSVWYYQSWFVLMVAGALGAFTAWAIIEPFFDDAVTFVGNVEAVDPEARHPMAPQLAGKIEVSDTSVWFIAGAKVDQGDGVLKALDPRVFKVGQVVEVTGQAATAGNELLIAYQVRIRPGDTGKYPRTDLSHSGIRTLIIGLLVFPIVAGFVGLAVGGADGFVSRAFGRGTLCALVGLGMGVGVGLVASFAGEVLYAVLGSFVHQIDKEPGLKMSTGAFLLQMMNRGLAWALTGIAMGMGQGVALRSKKLFINGLIGGVVGGLLGGLLFDPIDYALGGGEFRGEANASRAVGFTVIGLLTGLMVGIVELIARDAWLKMLAGPLAGKEFVIYKDPTSIGSAPKREVYIFKDPDVEPTHALLRRVGEGYEIEDQKTPSGTCVNGRKVSRQRLKNQDQIRIGSAILLFTIKED